MKLNEVKKITDPRKDEADRLLDQAERQLDVLADYGTLGAREKKKVEDIARLVIQARNELQK
jgi:hypothetical protein